MVKDFFKIIPFAFIQTKVTFKLKVLTLACFSFNNETFIKNLVQL